MKSSINYYSIAEGGGTVGYNKQKSSIFWEAASLFACSKINVFDFFFHLERSRTPEGDHGVKNHSYQAIELLSNYTHYL